MHAHSTYTRYTCKLPSSISGFRSKNTTYGALASGKMKVMQAIRTFILRLAALQASNSKLSALQNFIFCLDTLLDWNVTDERILFGPSNTIDSLQRLPEPTREVVSLEHVATSAHADSGILFTTSTFTTFVLPVASV